MSEIAATLGLGAEWEFRGKKYRISTRTFKHEGYFERWCEQQQLLAIRRHANDANPLLALTPAEYQYHMDGWRRDCARHHYRYPNIGCLEMLATVEGSKYMAYLQLSAANPQITEEFVEQVFDAPAELDEQGQPKLYSVDEKTGQKVPLTPWVDLMQKLEVQADADPLPRTEGEKSPPSPASAS